MRRYNTCILQGKHVGESITSVSSFLVLQTRLLSFQHTPEKKKTPELSFCTGHAKRILRIQSATVDLQCGCILLAPHHVG